MYSSKNPRDVNVLVGRDLMNIRYSFWDLGLEERIAVMEHKQRAQQHVLKVFRLQRNKKVSGFEKQVKEVRKENKRKRKQIERMVQQSKQLPKVLLQTEEHKLLCEKNLNLMRYEKCKLETKLEERHTNLKSLLRLADVRDKQTSRQCCMLENRLADEAMKNNMALTITIYYKEIRCKLDKDHPKWPPRIRKLKMQLTDLTADLLFLKKAARLAINEKSQAVKKYQKSYYYHVKDREERRRQQQTLIDHIRSLKDEYIPFPEVKPLEERFRAQSPRSTYEHCLHALQLQEAFDTMQQNIPGGGNVETVIERLETQVTTHKKLKDRVAELHGEQVTLMADVERLEQHRSLLQYGGCDLHRRHEEYVRKLSEAITQDTKTAERVKSNLQVSATLLTKLRAGFCSTLDTIRGADRMKGEPYPDDVIKLFVSVEQKLDELAVKAKDAKPDDLKEVRRPGFRHFMENELDRQIGDDPVGRILAQNQSILQQRDEDLEADMDNNIDIDEFRNALKNKSIKLYLSRCTRAKALKGVPSAMMPQYRPEKESSNQDMQY